MATKKLKDFNRCAQINYANVQDVKDCFDLRAYASQHLLVDKNHKAVCPFHPDKNPSLHFYRESFYCFGCGASGDIIAFVMKIRNISFIEAVKQLAAEGGVTILSSTDSTEELIEKRKHQALKVVKVNYEEFLFKELEKAVFTYLYYQMRILPIDREDWEAVHYTKELILFEQFDELEKLNKKRKVICDEERRKVRLDRCV